MEKNYSSTDRSSAFDRALSLPHFDEEATLLSARPVVPLHEVQVETGSRRRVSFALTIVAAVLVGAISATLLVQRGQSSLSAAESEVNQPTAASTGASGGSTSEPAEARVSLARQPEESQMVEVPSARDSVIKKRQTAVLLSSPIKPKISRSSAKPARPDYERAEERSEDFENDEREMRRAERRDERREARRQHRQRREGDDVLRIREIFEGSRRP